MKYIVIQIIIITLCTQIIRIVPIMVFKKKITNTFIKSFLHYMPFAVLTAMTFPAFLYSTNSILSAVVGLGVAFILAFLNRGLMTVTTFSCLGVLISELLIRYFK